MGQCRWSSNRRGTVELKCRHNVHVSRINKLSHERLQTACCGLKIASTSRTHLLGKSDTPLLVAICIFRTKDHAPDNIILLILKGTNMLNVERSPNISVEITRCVDPPAASHLSDLKAARAHLSRGEPYALHPLGKLRGKVSKHCDKLTTWWLQGRRGPLSIAAVITQLLSQSARYRSLLTVQLMNEMKLYFIVQCAHLASFNAQVPRRSPRPIRAHLLGK